MRSLAPVRGRGMRRVGEANAKPTRRWVRGCKKENPLIEYRPQFRAKLDQFGRKLL